MEKSKMGGFYRMNKIQIYGSRNRRESTQHNVPIANIVIWSESRFGPFSCEVLLMNGDVIYTSTPSNVIEARIKEAEKNGL